MRMPPIPLDRLDAAQRRIHDEIVAGPRGEMVGPLWSWMRSPELIDRAQKLGEFVRFRSSLPPLLSELAILVTARQWDAQFEWWAHEKIARKAGVDDAVIAAIRDRAPPPLADPRMKVVYEVSMAVHRDHTVGEPLYREAVGLLGERGVVDLIGILGYYTLVSMTLNVFEVPIPGDEPPPLR